MSTPGPRKFLPLNQNQFKTPKPAFKRPGSSSNVGSSPFHHSSVSSVSVRFAKTLRDEQEDIDDIDSSFGRQNEVRGSSPSDVRAKSRGEKRQDELICDDEDDDETGPHSRANFKTPHHQPSEFRDAVQEIEEDDLSPRPTKRARNAASGSKLLPPRQTIVGSSSLQNQVREEILIEEIVPNAPDQDLTVYDNNDEKEEDDEEDDDDDLLPEVPTSPSHPPPASSSSTTIPRFKAPSVMNLSQLPPSKTPPHFKHPPHFATSMGSRSITTGSAQLLPDTFSPSRRRGGKREYIPGGFADTVRNWVVELGVELTAQAAATSASAAGRKPKKELGITAVKHDTGEGRWVEVWDGDGEHWLLASQGVPADVNAVKVGDCIEVDGGAGSWEIDLDTDGLERSGEQEEEDPPPQEEKTVSPKRILHVSVLWRKIYS